jgi:hypothetical protein
VSGRSGNVQKLPSILCTCLGLQAHWNPQKHFCTGDHTIVFVQKKVFSSICRVDLGAPDFLSFEVNEFCVLTFSENVLRVIFQNVRTIVSSLSTSKE